MGCVGSDEHLPGATSVKVQEDTSSSSARIKFLCSLGGKILPKPDGQLRYVGGDTRLVSFNKNMTFTDMSSKLERLFGSNLCLKYQLPNEDLDTLISVTCDDDVENLVEEFDKNEARDGASRLRAFLFPRSGMPSRDRNPCACHGLDEAKSPKALGTITTTSRVQVVECSCGASAALHAPDFVFGMDNVCCVHGCRQQHHEGDCQLSPRPLVDDKAHAMKLSARPISPTSMQGEYLRQQSSKFVDSVGRGPALTTSALGPLVSTPHHQHTWGDRRKAWEEGSTSFNQRGGGDEKRHMELNQEIHYHNLPQDGGMGIPMTRVLSKDRMVPGYMEGDSQATMERQSRPRAEHHLEMAEPLPEVRHDVHFQGTARLYKPPDVQRVNTAAQTEMQWGLAAQPIGPSFHTVGERLTDSHRNSADSDEGPSTHRKLEVHAAADGMLHNVPIAIMPEASHGMKMQEVYRHDDMMLKQVRHGEFEVPPASPLQGQHEELHHLGTSHFQQVHWQAHEPQEQSQHHQVSGLEPIRVGHSTHGIPRHSLDFDNVSQGMVAHHHHMVCAQSNPRRSDTSTVTRLPSPLYRQVASGNSSRLDPPSPRRGQLPSGVGPHYSKPGGWGLNGHDAGFLPSSKAPLSCGLAGTHVYINAGEAHGVYDQHGNQVHLTEKGTSANLEASIHQAQYFDKMILANPDGAIGQVHSDNDLHYGGTSSNHDGQGIPP